MTKRELLVQIKRGPSSVEAKPGTTMYRIALSDSADIAAEVRIALSADHAYAVEDYATACASIAGELIPLTRKEADSIAALVVKTMKRREHPPGLR